MTVTIERVDGHICHDASTEASGLRWDAWKGQGALTLTYSSPNLSPNSYLISAVIYEGQNPTGIARMSGPLYFQIVSDHPHRGSVQLEHSWHANGAVAADRAPASHPLAGG